MQAFSDTQAVGWCGERGFVVEQNFPTRATVGGHEAGRFRIQIPDEATATVGLAYFLLMSGVRDYVEANFDGAMVWLRRWELWSESIDRVGQLLLEGVQRALEPGALLNQTPALVFKEGELVPAHASLTLPMLFQWDAFYCPKGGHFLGVVSHHGHLEVIAPKEAIGLLRERFSQWNPETLGSESAQ